LARLRYDAGEWMLEHSRDAPALIAERDPFEGVEGLPEVTGESLDAPTIAAGVQFHGGLLVRGFFSSQKVAKLRTHFETPMPDDVTGTEELRSRPGRDGVGSLGLFDLVAAYQEHGFAKVVQEYLGGRAVMDRVKLKRREKPGRLPWHQDAAFFGGRRSALNVWCALSPLSAGLELVPTPLDEVVGVSAEELDAGDISYNYLMQKPRHHITDLLARVPSVAPALEAGDALLFDEMTMHRTAIVEKDTFREVVVTWFFAPSRLTPLFPVPAL
jgi:hypothetical protein